MTDKELLELAAKACGIRLFFNNGKTYFRADMESPHDLWNPINDDGDALRLAVKLGLLIHVETCYYVHCMKEQTHVTEHIGNDGSGCLYEATRRAIVRVAAEIGKGIS